MEETRIEIRNGIGVEETYFLISPNNTFAHSNIKYIIWLMPNDDDDDDGGGDGDLYL